MSTQSEAQLEQALIEQLVAADFKWVDIGNAQALKANLKTQLEKANGVTLTEREFETVLIKRGEHITTLRMMGIQIGLSKHRVKTFLRILEENNMIVLKRDTKATHILVVDYVRYQHNETEVGQPQDSHEPKQ